MGNDSGTPTVCRLRGRAVVPVTLPEVLPAPVVACALPLGLAFEGVATLFVL